MTLIGALFIPCGIICMLWFPVYLLPLLIISSVFEASSVWNVSSGSVDFGLLPFYFVQSCVAVRFAFSVVITRKLLPSASNPTRRIAILLLLFWTWACASAFIMPRLFAGTLVMSPKSGMVQAPAPLQWNSSNLAQCAYLTLNICMVLYALNLVRTRNDLKQMLKGLYWAVFIVVSVGLTEALFNAIGVTFLYDIINNNPGYAQGFEQEVGSFHRISATFLEPSMAGSFLSAIAVGMLAGFLSGKRTSRWLLASFAVFLVLLLTTSTTGYAAFGVMAAVLFFYFKPFARKKRQKTGTARVWGYLAAGLAVIGLVLLAFPDLTDAIVTMTVDKFESFSFWARLASDVYSLVITVDTRGLGVGMGSNRSSGLAATLLSTVGVIGTGVAALALYKIMRAFPGKRATCAQQLTFWALMTILAGAVIAVPDLNRPTLWALILLVIVQLKFDFQTYPEKHPVALRQPPRKPLPIGPTAPAH